MGSNRKFSFITIMVLGVIVLTQSLPLEDDPVVVAAAAAPETAESAKEVVTSDSTNETASEKFFPIPIPSFIGNLFPSPVAPVPVAQSPPIIVINTPPQQPCPPGGQTTTTTTTTTTTPRSRIVGEEAAVEGEAVKDESPAIIAPVEQSAAAIVAPAANAGVVVEGEPAKEVEGEEGKPEGANDEKLIIPVASFSFFLPPVPPLPIFNKPPLVAPAPIVVVPGSGNATVTVINPQPAVQIAQPIVTQPVVVAQPVVNPSSTVINVGG